MGKLRFQHLDGKWDLRWWDVKAVEIDGVVIWEAPKFKVGDWVVRMGQRQYGRVVQVHPNCRVSWVVDEPHGRIEDPNMLEKVDA